MWNPPFRIDYSELGLEPEREIPLLKGRPFMEKRIRYGSTFAVLATAALAFSLLQSLIIPAIPLLERTLHTSTSGATWLLTGYLLSAAIATPILGRIGDMVGKEKMIVIVLVALVGRDPDQRVGDHVSRDARRPDRAGSGRGGLSPGLRHHPR